jgi:hypothetical protein
VVAEITSPSLTGPARALGGLGCRLEPKASNLIRPSILKKKKKLFLEKKGLNYHQYILIRLQIMVKINLRNALKLKNVKKI